MGTFSKLMCRVFMMAAVGAGLSACGGSDLGMSSAGDSIKSVFVSPPAPAPDIPDRPRLSMPPANAALPTPGQQSVAQQNESNKAGQPQAASR